MEPGLQVLNTYKVLNIFHLIIIIKNKKETLDESKKYFFNKYNYLTTGIFIRLRLWLEIL
jgi:hypothetical protein